MSFCFWKRLCLPAVLVLGWGVAACAQESAPRRSQPILFSEPKHDTVSSNLDLIATKKTTLRNLEDDLKKPFELFGGANSLSGTPVLSQRPPPPPPRLSNKRIRELMEQRDEWMFESPQDREGATPADDLFKTTDADLAGEGNRKKNSLERYYDRLEKMRVASTNQIKSGDPFKNNDPFNLQKDRELGETLNLQASGNPLGADRLVMEQLFKQVAKPENRNLFGNEDEDKTAGPLFGLGKVESTPQILQAQEARREKFRTLLEPRSPMASGISAALKPFGDTTATTFATPNTLGLTPGDSGQGSLQMQPNFVGKPVGPPELPPVAAALPSLSPTPLVDPFQKPEKPRPVSTFNIPRRNFGAEVPR